MSYLGTVLESLTNKIQGFQDSKITGVSGFSFWAIEPIQKDGNDGKFRKPHFSGTLVNGVLCS